MPDLRDTENQLQGQVFSEEALDHVRWILDGASTSEQSS